MGCSIYQIVVSDWTVGFLVLPIIERRLFLHFLLLALYFRYYLCYSILNFFLYVFLFQCFGGGNGKPWRFFEEKYVFVEFFYRCEEEGREWRPRHYTKIVFGTSCCVGSLIICIIIFLNSRKKMNWGSTCVTTTYRRLVQWNLLVIALLGDMVFRVLIHCTVEFLVLSVRIRGSIDVVVLMFPVLFIKHLIVNLRILDFFFSF